MTTALLDGKVAIVSGVGPGLGTSVCAALLCVTCSIWDTARLT